MSFYGAPDTPVLDFQWRLLWVSKARVGTFFHIPMSRPWWGSKPGSIMPLLTLWDHAARHSTRLRFFVNIFGWHKSFLWGHWYPLHLVEMYVLHVPRDSPLVQHLPTSLWPAWQLSHSLPHTCEHALIGLETGIYHATAASQCETSQMLYSLSYAGSALKWNIRCCQSCHSVSMSVHAEGGIPMWPLPTWDTLSPRSSPTPNLTMQESPLDMFKLVHSGLHHTGTPKTCSNLFTWTLQCRDPPKTCSKVGGWPSTERSSSSIGRWWKPLKKIWKIFDEMDNLMGTKTLNGHNFWTNKDIDMGFSGLLL